MATTHPLDGIGAIRKRPEMYAGNRDTPAGPLYLLSEVLARAVDEHLRGDCTRIDVRMHSDGSISVSDDGAGISVAPDEHGTSWLESLLTKMHDLPFDESPAHVQLHRHRTVLHVVSALSASLSAEVRREDQRWRIELEQGRVTKPLAMMGPAETSGTTIRFKLDASIFAMPAIEAEAVARRVREISALLPRLTTCFSCELQEYVSNQGVAPLLTKVDAPGRRYGPATGETRGDEPSAQVAFEWIDSPTEHVVGYCNLDMVHEGTHIDGFRLGLADALGRDDCAHVYEALSPGLNAVVSVLVIDPNYRSRPYKVASKEAQAVVREATKLAFKSALKANEQLREHVSKRLESRGKD